MRSSPAQRSLRMFAIFLLRKTPLTGSLSIFSLLRCDCDSQQAGRSRTGLAVAVAALTIVCTALAGPARAGRSISPLSSPLY